jgi:hypothetical protein
LNLRLVELGKPFVFLDRGRAIERKLQYQRVKDCGESESQQNESSGKKITRWIGFDNSLERGQTSTWSSTRKKAESNFFVKEKFSYEN